MIMAVVSVGMAKVGRVMKEVGMVEMDMGMEKVGMKKEVGIAEEVSLLWNDMLLRGLGFRSHSWTGKGEYLAVRTPAALHTRGPDAPSIYVGIMSNVS